MVTFVHRFRPTARSSPVHEVLATPLATSRPTHKEPP